LGPYWAKKVVWNGGSGETAAARAEAGSEAEADVSQSLLAKIRDVQAKFVTLEGVDYKAMKDSPLFEDYVKSTEALRSIDVAKELADAAKRKAFFINVYNALLIHAMVEIMAKNKAPKTLLQRLRLYATASYDIGGFVLSLNDIENGILRGNRKGAAPWAKHQFEAGSKEEDVLVVSCDPRIHFALNCGARSCPPVRFYKPESVDDDLDKATKSFFMQPGGMEVAASEEGEGYSVKSTQLLKWYQNDFVIDQRGAAVEDETDAHKAVLQWVSRFFREESEVAERAKAALKGAALTWDYFDYDWSTNVA